MLEVNTPISLSTFKLVRDNLDKTIRPRIETSEHHTQSLHYFYGYAVKDRIDMSEFDDAPCLPNVSDIDVEKVLPTSDYESAIKENMAILAARVVRKHIPYF